MSFYSRNVNVLSGKGGFMDTVIGLADTAKGVVLEDVIRILEEEISKNTDEAIRGVIMSIKKQTLLLVPPTTGGATRGFGSKSFR